jgi:hypothetical protein
MKIDLRNVYTRWINLDEKTDNAEMMEELFQRCGMTNTHRFSAIRKSATHEGVRKGEEHYPGIAESQFACMRDIVDNGLPGLILEDDIEVTEIFPNTGIIEVPDDADAVYLGISHGDGNYEAIDVGNGLCKISKMLSGHACLYITKNYISDILNLVPDAMYEHQRPFDVFTYQLQGRHNVYAYHHPLFYQADAKNNANKWEHMTRTPLRLKSQIRLGTMS